MQNELMKNIPPNAWRPNLKETDWNFGRCPSEELGACVKWELGRERAQAGANGIMPTSPLTAEPTAREESLYRCWHDRLDHCPDWWDESLSERLRQLSKVPDNWGIRHPHFPQLSYWEHRQKDKWRRSKEPEPEWWTWIDLEWWNLIRYARGPLE